MMSIQLSVIDTLISLALSKLKMQKSILSYLRMLSIDLEKEQTDNMKLLLEKQQACVEKINQIDAAYLDSLQSISDPALRSALSPGKVLALADEFPNDTLFSILREQRDVMRKIWLLNSHTIDKTEQLSSEYRNKIKEIKQRKSFYMRYSAGGPQSGRIFDFKEGKA